MTHDTKKYLKYISALNGIGVALAAESKHTRVLEAMLSGAMAVTGADGCTLYLLTSDKKLAFSIFANKSLDIRFNHMIPHSDPVMTVDLYDHNDQPNLKNVSSYCFHKNTTINIKDAYLDDEFDFSGIIKFDASLGYHSKSFLAVPLRDQDNNAIGVIQLINAMDDSGKEIIPFSEESVRFAESLAAQVSLAITQHDLLMMQQSLHDTLVQSIVKLKDGQ
jgi:GAF domain-containing protein